MHVVGIPGSVTLRYPTDNMATSPTDSRFSAAIYNLPRPPAISVGDSGVFVSSACGSITSQDGGGHAATGAV